VLLAQAEVQQSAQVEAGEAVVEPQVVLGDAAVVDFAVAASHEPGQGPFDHRPVLPVGLLECVGLGVASGRAQQLLMLVDLDGSVFAGGGAPGSQWTAVAGNAERRGAAGADRAGGPGGQVTVRAVWSMAKSSAVKPPGTGARTGIGLINASWPASASVARAAPLP
jgi:hypothetical protein